MIICLISVAPTRVSALGGQGTPVFFTTLDLELNPVPDRENTES